MNNEQEVQAHSNVQSAGDELTQKEIARAIAQLKYRKTRQKRIKLAMDWVRQHPELLAAKEGDVREEDVIEKGEQG